MSDYSEVDLDFILANMDHDEIDDMESFAIRELRILNTQIKHCADTLLACNPDIWVISYNNCPEKFMTFVDRKIGFFDDIFQAKQIHKSNMPIYAKKMNKDSMYGGWRFVRYASAIKRTHQKLIAERGYMELLINKIKVKLSSEVTK